ncbi:MAG TPA: hypothetical protein VGY58_23790 [Gemmataceae bacterium]|jgi:cytochrome oxidase Cu insertion factor (SCO1/SenC/PrrC family)|nr:hypothetical protein [Gemmataceae bacterium]
MYFSFPKRPTLRILVAVLAVQAVCALALNLFTWRASSANDAAPNQAHEPPRYLTSELRAHAGQWAPPFSLRDPDGKETALEELVGPRPVVVEFGSFT